MFPKRAALVIALALASCANGGIGAADGDGDDRTDTPSSRCQSAPAALVSRIESGLTVSGGGSLSNAFAVKSNDFENVYFVGAQIEGAGLTDTVGVWAANDLSGSGLTFSADAVAREFSEWGDGPGFNLSDDGLEEVRDCAGG